MKIVITNDDGFEALGIHELVDIMQAYGELTIVAPKFPQSGMSMAVTMGYKPIAVRHIEKKEGQDWWYLDGTPASCVKFAIDNVLVTEKPDLVISGINHGSNAATAAIYSGTLGAAMEGAVNGILSIGVSLDSFKHDADFSAVKLWLPKVTDWLLEHADRKFGAFYNVNFPELPAAEIKGVRLCHMGKVHWENEYRDFHAFLAERGREASPQDLEYIAAMHPEEQLYVMAGDMTHNEGNCLPADHLCLEEGWITITPHNIDNTDYGEFHRLNNCSCDIIL